MGKYKFTTEAYFKVPLGRIHPVKERKFPLFIYLSRNDHLLLRFLPEHEVTAEQLQYYYKHGLENFWCPIEFEAAWQEYLRDNPEAFNPDAVSHEEKSMEQVAAEVRAAAGLGEEDANTKTAKGDGTAEALLTAEKTEAEIAEEAAEKAAKGGGEDAEKLLELPTGEGGTEEERVAKKEAEEAAAEEERRAEEEAKEDEAAARSDEAAVAIEVLESDDFTEEEKKEVLQEISKGIMNTLADVAGDSKEAREEAMERVKEFAEDIIKVAASTHRMGQLWDEIKSVKEMKTPHSGAVSAFAVILGMGIGYSEKETLADLSFGAMLHDIGVVAVNPVILAKSENDYTPDEAAAYKEHVAAGIALIAEKQIEMTPEVQQIVEQHHERFDGSGYPKGLRAFEISELAQIVAIADYLDDLMTGRFDGKERSPAEALDVLEGLQDPDGLGKKYFSPELFESISQLLKGTRSKESDGESDSKKKKAA